MFNLSTKEVVLSIEKAPLTNLNGTYFQEYTDFFGNFFSLPNLKEYETTKLEYQEDLPRFRLNYNEVIMKKLKVFFMNSNITKALESKFGTNLSFESVDIWIDNSGYRLRPHTDDARIKLALQIYLGNDNVGTTLYDQDGNPVHTFPFRKNCGYALLNSDRSFHGVEKITSDGRTSLYVRYV